MNNQILSCLKKRGYYTLDLYRFTKFEGTLQAFELILNAGLEAGLWQVSDNYWTLQKPQAQPTALPLDVEVDYLLNFSRQFTHPTQKNRHFLQTSGYFNHENYSVCRSTLREMFARNREGYQLVPGKFARDAHGVIKRKTCWQSQQVFMAEFDEGVTADSLEAVVADSVFIRENAVALVESIRSRYDDPTDSTCNGELRYRAFFITPRPVVNLKPAEFLVAQLLEALPDADGSGSSLSNGAFGLKGANALFLDNFVSETVLAGWTEAWEHEQTSARRYSFPEHINIKEIPTEHADALQSLEYAADGWSQEALPCCFKNHEHDGWQSHQNAMYVFRHNDFQGYTFYCHKCPPGDNKRTFRVKPRKSGKRRVKQVSEPEAVYASLASAEIENEAFWKRIVAPRVFDYNRRAMLIQTDTGVGKDYAMLMAAKENDVLSLNPHSRLSAQLTERAEDEGLDAFHIKSRLHGFDIIRELPLVERIAEFKKNPEVMCIHADRCQALLEQTANCKDVLCNAEQCEVYDFCSEHRYVSQIPKAAQCQSVFYSWLQLPTDPGSKGIVEQIMTARRKYDRADLLWVVGEVDASKLLNRHTVEVTEIQRGLGLWGDTPAGELYRLLGELCVPTWTANQRWDRLVADFHKIELSVVSRQLSKIPVKIQNGIEEVSVPTALAEELISIMNPTAISEIPRVYPPHWTLVEQIDRLLTYCANPEPPIFFDGQALQFVTPPELHRKVDTYVMQSATADASQIENLLCMMADDIDFEVGTAARVEHHPDARIFKVATGRYVRTTCFVYDKEWCVVALKESIRPHLENLLRILQNTPGEKLVNTYKAIYDGDELKDDELIQALRAEPNIIWSNWAAGYGLDLDDDTTIIEFGTNEPSADILTAACAEIYMGDPIPLDFSFDEGHEHDGVRIEGVRTYKDSRVQRQYEQMASSAQYQMANRTRPVRNPSRVLIYSSHPCPELDSRVQWVTPDMLGGNLQTFAVAEPKTAFQRERDEKKALAIELAREGLSNKEIAKQLGYQSQSSVANLLKGVDLS